MTKKDYILLAKCFKEVYTMLDNDAYLSEKEFGIASRYIGAIKGRIENALNTDNPKFDEMKFNDACLNIK